MVRVLALQGDLRQSAVVMLGNLRPSEVLELKSGDSEFQERLRSKPRLSSVEVSGAEPHMKAH